MVVIADDVIDNAGTKILLYLHQEPQAHIRVRLKPYYH